MRLGILATHPVQYQAPLYRALSRDPAVDLTVFYAHDPTPEQQGEGFGVAFSWDVDLLSGYRSVFLKNEAAAKGTGFRGYDTPEIREHVRRGAFDAFLITGWHAWSLMQGAIACWRAGIPTMVRGDSYLLGDESSLTRAVKRVVYPPFLRRFDASLAVGTRSEEYFRYFGARRVFRVPHFVDNEFFAVSGRSGRTRDALRDAWGIPRDAFVCAFVGKLSPVKRPLDLFAAASGQQVHLLIAGDGELRTACEAEAARLSVPATFLGFVNQAGLPDVYAAADVLALTSERETWGIVVNEAMASGLPVIVSDSVGSAPDLVVEGKTGHVFRRGDVGELRSKLSLMRRELADGVCMGDTARRLISNYSAERSAAALVEAALAVIPPRRQATLALAAGEDG